MNEIDIFNKKIYVIFKAIMILHMECNSLQPTITSGVFDRMIEKIISEYKTLSEKMESN